MSAEGNNTANQSIIQSTLMKISILIFCVFILLYFFIARNFWDKEVLTRKLELLSIASKTQVLVQSCFDNVKMHKENKNLTIKEKITRINSVLQPLLDKISEDNPDIGLGYYDIELDSVVAIAPNFDPSLLKNIPRSSPYFKSYISGKPEFVSDETFTDWDGKGIIAVTVPVYYNNKIIGHTWANVNANDIFFISAREYFKVLALSLILWLLVLLIIRKHMEQIESSLDCFSQMIVKNNYDKTTVLHKLPELKPVFDKIQDHTDKLQKLNSQLEYSKNKLITIMEGISDGFYVLDRNWRFVFVNNETRKKFNCKDNTELLGKSIWEVSPKAVGSFTYTKLQEAMSQNEPVHWEARAIIRPDKYYEFHAYPFKEGLTVFFRDITELKLQQQELARLERLNLIGQLAAGISHEVRNPLTTVRGFLQMLGSKSESEQNKEYMDLMISEIDRANAIITDFLSLAKANSDNITLKNINEIISKVFPMLQADAFNSSKDVLLDLNVVPDIMLNESEIRQLILNLVRNGLEATPENGKVIISTYLKEEKVVLAIKDEGPGIPEEIQDKIGTPFLTTKETGTGLGLAISMGIARRHNAVFEFDTGKEGTTFYIKFPLYRN